MIVLQGILDQVACKPVSILPAGDVKINFESQSYNVCKVISEGGGKKKVFVIY